MRTPNAYAIAVRKADGTIVNTAARLPKWSDKYPLLKLPVLRGAAVLVQSMALGIKALNYSAGEAFAGAEAAEEVEVVLTPAVIAGEGDFAGITGATPGLIPFPTRKRPKDELKRGQTAGAAGSIAFALFFNVLLFIVTPLVLTNALFNAAGWALRRAKFDRSGKRRADSAGRTDAAAPAAPATAATDATAARRRCPWYTRAYNSARLYLRPVRPSVAFTSWTAASACSSFSS